MKRSVYLLIIVFGALLNINSQIPTSGLVGHWPFDGDANDISGNNLNGIINGAALCPNRYGFEDMAMEFNGPNSHITILNDPLLDLIESFSFSFWIKFHNDTMNHIILMKGNNSTNEYSVTGNIGLNKQNVTKVVKTDSGLLSNKWYHIVITYGDNLGKVYVDSILSNTGTLNDPPFGTSNTNLYIGEYVGEGATWPAYLIGALDELRIYNRVLTDTEIKALYNEYKCHAIVYDTVHVTVYDTIPVFDTIPVYDSIAVTDTLIIDVTITGTNPSNDINSLKVYPNPVKDIIFIHTGNNYELISDYKIQILNSLGSIIFESNITQQLFEIDVSDFGETGLFLINIIDNSNHVTDTRKLILK